MGGIALKALILSADNFEDQEVVVDGNLITSRHPRDLYAFGRELVNHPLLSQGASHFNEYLSDSQMGLNSGDTRRTMSHPLSSSALRKTGIGCYV